MRADLHYAGSGDADAGVVCHGSLLNEEDVEGIKKPVLFLYSANDQQIPDEKREKFQGILKTKSFPAEGVYYPDQACPLTHPPLVPNDNVSIIIQENHLGRYVEDGMSVSVDSVTWVVE